MKSSSWTPWTCLLYSDKLSGLLELGIVKLSMFKTKAKATPATQTRGGMVTPLHSSELGATKAKLFKLLALTGALSGEF